MAKTEKLVAIGTIRRGKLIEAQSSEADPKTGRVIVHPAKTERETIEPGKSFEADEAEAKQLIAAGVARREADKPIEPVQSLPVAPNTAPRLPKSGDTSPPNPDEVAEVATQDSTDGKVKGQPRR